MKILYAEDEKQLSMAVTEILKMEGFEVRPVYDGEEALENLKSDSFDIVVLDIMMPRLDGIKVLSIMRSNGIYTPVILLTAKAEVEDRIEGFKEGADDYLAKPFAMGELVARLNAMARRKTEYRIRNLELGNLYLDCESGEIRTESGSLRLSPKEAEMLTLLIKNNGRPPERSELLSVLGAEGTTMEEEDSAIELYAAYLRNKLRQIHAKPVIGNRGKGYYISLSREMSDDWGMGENG